MKKLKCLPILLLCVILSGCSGINFGYAYDNDSKIKSSSNSYNLSDYTQDLNTNHLTVSAGKFEGTNTIWTMDTESETDVDFSYTLSVSSGKAKLALIYPDGRISTLVECDADSASSTSSNTSLTLEAGSYRVKLVGAKDTSVELNLTASGGTLQKL